jgi:dolichyl-phosphate-mannose-protein mannosyltransferase
VLHFLLSETIEYPISVLGHFTPRRPAQWAELGTRGPIIVVFYFIALLIAFMYIAPLTYGTPGYVFHTSTLLHGHLMHYNLHRLDGETVNSKRLLSSWTLHFAAKPYEVA